jgi:DNA-binding response OmpR family regulator
MSKKILLIEDNKKHQRLIKSILKGRDYDFEVVNNGTEVINAEEKMKSGYQYDLMMVDIYVPDFNAVDFIERHKDKYGKKILVVSALSDFGEITELLPDDEQRIKKPFDTNELEKKVTEILG